MESNHEFPVIQPATQLQNWLWRPRKYEWMRSETNYMVSILVHPISSPYSYFKSALLHLDEYTAKVTSNYVP
jgi:hypothetical protein